MKWFFQKSRLYSLAFLGIHIFRSILQMYWTINCLFKNHRLNWFGLPTALSISPAWTGTSLSWLSRSICRFSTQSSKFSLRRSNSNDTHINQSWSYVRSKPGFPKLAQVSGAGDELGFGNWEQTTRGNGNTWICETWMQSTKYLA